MADDTIISEPRHDHRLAAVCWVNDNTEDTILCDPDDVGTLVRITADGSTLLLKCDSDRRWYWQRLRPFR
jgi:hypothetical protein